MALIRVDSCVFVAFSLPIERTRPDERSAEAQSVASEISLRSPPLHAVKSHWALRDSSGMSPIDDPIDPFADLFERPKIGRAAFVGAVARHHLVDVEAVAFDAECLAGDLRRGVRSEVSDDRGDELRSVRVDARAALDSLPDTFREWIAGQVERDVP